MDKIEKKVKLDVPVQYLPGVGPKSAKKLAKLGVETIGDLIYYFPRKYLDYSDISKIADIQNQKSKIKNQNYGREPVSKKTDSWQLEAKSFTIKARIVGIANKRTRRRGFSVTEAVVEDGTGTLKVVWFNQPFLAKMMWTGREIILHGRINWDYFNQTFTMESPDWAEKPKIVPVYRETDGISTYYISRLISKIKDQISKIDDFLPQEIIKRNGLLGLDDTIKILHEPANMEELAQARRRMAFDELFLISLRGQVLKQELKKDKAVSIDTKNPSVEKLIEKLPYELTRDQKQAWQDIADDLARETPMNRMLNGDVGSGKTVVAALAAYSVYCQNKSAVLMAPTEILANQHFQTFKTLLPEDTILELVVSSNKKQRSELDLDKPKILIGTHALLYLEKIPDLAMVIIDEQHRFGVNQRQALKQMMLGKEVPHFLSMTATPIPRSLQLALFAELDMSVIREKPKNRKEIKTRVVDEVHRQKAYEFIRAHVKAGRQVFIICPLIEDNNDESRMTNDELFEIDRKTVASEYEKLSKEIFPDLRIGMLHGKMKSAEKDEIMSQFSSAEIDIMVSTSVVEVGVDIPNATVMMIEDAERFGLAQLHQFRGRVGRGKHQSFCFLFSNSQSEKSLRRLRMMEETADGFKLAEFDLKNRGAGDIFGLDQSGFMDIKFADLGDVDLIASASKSAKDVVATDSKLSQQPLLRSKLEKFNSSKHFE